MIGTAPKANIRRNSDAQPGDKLILTKALGVGIYSAAFKKSALSRGAYDEFMASTTLLNRIGARLGEDPAVHAMTDVTGFGLLGHALEIARGSHKTVTIDASRLPYLKDAVTLAQNGFITGASGETGRATKPASSFRLEHRNGSGSCSAIRRPRADFLSHARPLAPTNCSRQ